MQLSIVMPSHGANLLIYSRIMHACTVAGPQVEIVVRDNSGDPSKRKFLDGLKRDYCNFVSVEPCAFVDNFRSVLDLAEGDFVFIVSDDDMFYPRAITSILKIATERAGDPTFVGMTGLYALEQAQGSMFIRYQGLDSPEMMTRVGGYLSFQGPNLLGYSVIRRDVAIGAWEFTCHHPFAFSFHDQIVSMLYTMAGRFADVNRLIFMYDNTNWEFPTVAAREDLKFYTAMGMDPALGRFHWFLCGIEGAILMLHSRYGRQHPMAERQKAATRWFEVMFARFKNDRRTGYGSPLDGQAEKLCAKWKNNFPTFELDEALEDMCAFISLSSPERGVRYREFWRSVVAGTTPVSALAS